MKRYYFILTSLSSEVADDRVRQELRNVLDHIGRSKADDERLISLIDVGLWRQEIVEYCQWTDFDDVTRNFDGFLATWKSVKTENQSSLADVFHKLCDKFPAPGTYLADVVWLLAKEEHIPIIRDDIEVFGALMRLRVWHKSLVTFCCSGRHMFVTRQLSEWSQNVPVQVVSGPLIGARDVFPPGVVWRGAVQLTDRENGVSRHLDGFQLLFEGSDGRMDHRGVPTFDGPLTIAAECDLAGVPPHYISPDRYRLSLPPITSNSLLEDSWRFLSVVNSTKNSCRVLRLHLADIQSGGDQFRTEQWRKRIISGDFSEEYRADGAIDRRHFLLVGDGLCTAYSATLFALRDSSAFNPEACRALVLGDLAAPAGPRAPLSSDALRRLPKCLPPLTGRELDHLQGAISEAQSWARDRYIDENKSAQPEELQLLDQEVGGHILERWRRELDPSRLKSAPVPIVEAAAGGNEEEEEDSDSDSWPERQFLRACTLDRGGAESTATRSSLMNADDIRRIFETDSKWETVLKDCGKHFRSASHPSPSMLTSWSSARHCNYHDVYYNRDPSGEARQLASDEMRLRHVPADTISSANVAELRQLRDSRPAFTPPPSEMRSSSPLPPPPPATSSGTRRSRQPEVAGAVRRSPRHRRPAPSVALTENHLKKLRGAVLDVLESRRVRVDHPLFRDCAKKLFEVCRSYAKDVVGDRGSITRRFHEIAQAQVKQVISFVQERGEQRRRSARH